jgi:hypothetical protein
MRSSRIAIAVLVVAVAVLLIGAFKLFGGESTSAQDELAALLTEEEGLTAACAQIKAHAVSESDALFLLGTHGESDIAFDDFPAHLQVWVNDLASCRAESLDPNRSDEGQPQVVRPVPVVPASPTLVEVYCTSTGFRVEVYSDGTERRLGILC